jgi:hypothetical protein
MAMITGVIRAFISFVPIMKLLDMVSYIDYYSKAPELTKWGLSFTIAIFISLVVNLSTDFDRGNLIVAPFICEWCSLIYLIVFLVGMALVWFVGFKGSSKTEVALKAKQPSTFVAQIQGDKIIVYDEGKIHLSAKPIHDDLFENQVVRLECTWHVNESKIYKETKKENETDCEVTLAFNDLAQKPTTLVLVTSPRYQRNESVQVYRVVFLPNGGAADE